jgi:predicted nucleotidyltransferase
MSEAMNAFGLPVRWFDRAVALLAAHPKVKQVLVYGSRARGDFNPASDLDLAVDAPEITLSEFARLRMDFDDLPFVLKSDLVWLQGAGEALRTNILRDAKTVFQREDTQHSCQESL